MRLSSNVVHLPNSINMAICKSCFSKCSVNSFFKWLMASCVVVWIKRIVPLLTSLWMEVDMGLDVRQTLIYYDHAFNHNGTYASWALEYNKTTTGTVETVHPGYFYTSIVVWVLPPFLFWSFLWLQTFFFGVEFNPFFIVNNCLIAQFSSFELSPPFKKKFQNILFYIVYSPFDLLISAIWVYVYVPIISIKSGIIIAWTGENDGQRMITKRLPEGIIPRIKLYENVGEAVPQAIMCLLFISNNYNFILHEETSTWMPIPVSIVSFVFSVGSIAMGLYTGIHSFLDSCRNFDTGDCDGACKCQAKATFRPCLVELSSKVHQLSELGH